MVVGDLVAIIRSLNTVTVPDCHPVPNIADFTSRISGSMVFSKLDFQKGYYQVTVSLEVVQKTAIITPFGMFEFLLMWTTSGRFLSSVGSMA